jgi:hypothetical protein
MSDAAHRRKYRMSLLKYISTGLALVALSTAALAFQEQTSGGAAAPSAASKPVELVTPNTTALKPTIGTDVRIPGFGKLGSLPKMDFGLELLYGAAEAKRPDAPSQDDARDDLTIRGSVKHKF